MGKEVRKQSDPLTKQATKSESVKILEAADARKADRGFYIAFMLLGGILALVGGVGGSVIGNPIREITVPGPPPKILSMTNEKMIETLGEPSQSVSCDQLIKGVPEGLGKCRIYLSENNETILIVASGITEGK